MASASGDGDQGTASAYCATCGRPLTVGLVACPNCGTPILGPTSPASWGTQAMPDTPGNPAAASHGQYLTPGMTPPQPPMVPARIGGAQPWAETPTAAGADPATWQPLAPMTRRRSRRGVWVGTVAAVVVLSLLATGVAYLLGAFTAHTELDAAKYLPGNAVFFGGMDVVSLASNSHGIKQQDLTTLTGSDSALKSSGLDFQADVMPWLGRDIAVGAFPGAGGQSANPMSDMGAVVLLQSHDDGKAQAAMQKAANHRPDNAASGWAVTTTSYGGFTLYTQPSERYDKASGTTANDPNGSTFAAGKGWAIAGSNPAAAKLVIDRINGTGDTLAAQKSFVDATNSLPTGRFGTLYVNIQSLGDLITKSGAASLVVPGASLQQALQTYPTAVGYVSWTNSGLHAQLTAKAAKSTGITYPSGDTLGLARVVPGNAYAYVALNNLGGDLTANKAALGQAPQVTQLVQSFLGTSLDDPALAQPAALAIYPTPGTGVGIGGALLLREDATSANGLVQKFAAAQKCTTEAISVQGQAAQKLTCAGLYPSGASSAQVTQTSATSTDVTIAPQGSDTTMTTSTDMLATTSTTTIYVMQAGGALVVAPDEASLAPVAAAAKGSPSLAQATNFTDLSAQAPAKAQLLAYADVNAILTASHAPANNAQGNLADRTAALIITTASNDTQSQVNIDVKLNG